MLDNSFASTHVGTIAYWPPERLLDADAKYDIRSDVWSLGISLLEVILGKLPYMTESTSSQNPSNEHQRSTQLSAIFVLNCATTSLLDEIMGNDVRPKYSEELCDFVKSCLQKVENRPKPDALAKSIFYLANSDDSKQKEAREYIEDFKVSKIKF